MVGECSDRRRAADAAVAEALELITRDLEIRNAAHRDALRRRRWLLRLTGIEPVLRISHPLSPILWMAVGAAIALAILFPAS